MYIHKFIFIKDEGKRLWLCVKEKGALSECIAAAWRHTRDPRQPSVLCYIPFMATYSTTCGLTPITSVYLSACPFLPMIMEALSSRVLLHITDWLWVEVVRGPKRLHSSFGKGPFIKVHLKDLRRCLVL